MPLLFIVAVVFAALEWFFEYKENRVGIYFTKPAMMLFLIVWVWVYTDLPALMLGMDSSSIIWFILGLTFCLGGDVFLMLPERFFLPGLISFLLGHFFYIVGFGYVLPPESSTYASFVIAAALILLAGWVYTRLVAGMQAAGKTRMRMPVLIYTIVIAFMLYSALLKLFDPGWESTSAVLVGIGATLFLISDIMNAWVRFVGPIRLHRLWVMATYHLAQLGIAVGVAIHFSGMSG